MENPNLYNNQYNSFSKRIMIYPYSFGKAIVLVIVQVGIFHTGIAADNTYRQRGRGTGAWAGRARQANLAERAGGWDKKNKTPAGPTAENTLLPHGHESTRQHKGATANGSYLSQDNII
jgi:hypothetical protein